MLDRLRILVWALAALALAAGPVIAFLNPTTDALLVFATAAVLLTPVVVRAVQGRFDPFEPMFIFVMAYGVMFVVRPAAMLVRNEMEFSIAFQGVDLQSTFRPALVLGLLGAIGFVAGYFLRVTERLAARVKAPPDVNLDRVALAAFGLWILGACLYGIFLLTSADGGSVVALVFSGRSLQLTQAYQNSSAYLYSSPFLMVSATLILFGVGLARRSARLLWTAAASTALLCILLGPVGSRTVLFPLLLGLGVIFYTTRGTRPRAASLVVVTLLALFVSAVLLDVRSSYTRQAIGVTSSIKETAKDPLRIFDPLTTEHDAAEMPALAAALTVVPDEIGYKYGTGTLGDTLARPIPRQVWSGKPRQPKEQVISALWPFLYDAGIANPEFSVLLNFFIDGSYPGVLLGMMLYGVLAGGLFRWFRRNAGSVGARVIFASILPFLVSGVRDTPVDTLMRLAFVSLPVVAIFYLAGRYAMAPSGAAGSGSVGPGLRPPGRARTITVRASMTSRPSP